MASCLDPYMVPDNQDMTEFIFLFTVKKETSLEMSLFIKESRRRGDHMLKNMKKEKEPVHLQVCAFFKEGSPAACLLQKAVSVLESDRIEAVLSFQKTRIIPPKENLLIFSDSAEKAGQISFHAGMDGMKGLSIYGGTSFGINLKDGNIFSFFCADNFHSEKIYMADFAFPVISSSIKSGDQEETIFFSSLLRIYTGLMIYSAGNTFSLLEAMDRSRCLWRAASAPKSVEKQFNS